MIPFFVAIFLFGFVSGVTFVVSRRRSTELGLRHSKLIAGTVVLTTLVLIQFIFQSEAQEFIKNIFFSSSEKQTVNIFSFYFVSIGAILYIVFALITEDLLRNLDTFFGCFDEPLVKVGEWIAEKLMNFPHLIDILLFLDGDIIAEAKKLWQIGYREKFLGVYDKLLSNFSKNK